MGTQAMKRSRSPFRWATVFGAAMLLTTGCGKMEDTNANFVKAIDMYYSTRPSCLWTEPVKFPVREDASNTRGIKAYDALVYQELLARSSGRRMLVTAGTPVEVYDLTAKGRSQWSADSDQGYGNLCYGHRVVTSIDSASPTSSKSGAITDVVYRYSISDPTAWAKAAETQNTFPKLRDDLSGSQVGRATLTDSDKGWQVSSAPWAHISDSDIYK